MHKLLIRNEALGLMAEELRGFICAGGNPNDTIVGPTRDTAYVDETDARATATDPYIRFYHSSSQQSHEGSHSNVSFSANVTKARKRQPGPGRRCEAFVYCWWREITTCIIFVGALMALFATLYVYTDKPSPKWPTWLSLNTVVAIYVVVLNASVLLVTNESFGQLKWSWFAKAARPLDDIVKYEDATRGPFGATTLLWGLRARHLLSCLGALIVVLCLATDPFAKQIIRYYDCTVPSEHAEASLIPRTTYYTQANGVNGVSNTQSIQPPLLWSLFAGIFSPVGPPDVYCRTGNCTWQQDYSTLESVALVLTFRIESWSPATNKTSLCPTNPCLLVVVTTPVWVPLQTGQILRKKCSNHCARCLLIPFLLANQDGLGAMMAPSV